MMMMMMNNLECPIHLKVRLVDGTLDVRLMRVWDSTIRISFEVPAKRNPRQYLHIPYISETRVIDLNFCRCMYGSILIQICAVSSKRRIFSAPESNRVRFGRSRSSKVDDFGTKRKHIVTMVLSCTVSEIRRLIG